MRYVCILSMLCLLFSCSGHKSEWSEKFPADSLISRDAMVNILTDVHLVEASLNLQRNRGTITAPLTQDYYQWLYRKYHISPSRFRNSLTYYKLDPDKFNKLYLDVVKNLESRIKTPATNQKKNLGVRKLSYFFVKTD